MINRVVLLGHVATEPEIRETNGGVAYAALLVGLTETWAQDGAHRRASRGVFVKVWDERYIEIIQSQPRKGELVYLEGRLSSQRRRNADGSWYTAHEVTIPRRVGIMKFIKLPPKALEPEEGEDPTITIGAETLAKLRAGEAVEIGGVGLVAADDLLEGQ